MAKQEKKKQKSATALCGAYHVILIFFFPFPQTRKNESWMQVILFPNFYYYFLVITRENAQSGKSADYVVYWFCMITVFEKKNFF